MKAIEIIDIHEEAAKYINSRQSELKQFINNIVLPDNILKKLWLFTFSHDPFNDSDYPLSNKIIALTDIQSSDIDFLFDRINENTEDKRFYEFLSLKLLPLYFALFIIQDLPEISLAETLDDMSQELLINYNDQDELNKSCRISNAWPNFSVIHTSSIKREELCVEFMTDFGIKEIQYLDNYAFSLFKKRRNEFDDLYWGEGNKEYFITLKSRSKQKTFPAPIFNKHIRLINKLSKKPGIRDKIVAAEMDGNEGVIIDTMKRRYFEAALKYQGKGSSTNYFKEVLKYDDDFKKVSAKINSEKKPGAKKTRVLKSKHQHSGGTIKSNGELEEGRGKDAPNHTPKGLQYNPIENIETHIFLIQLIDLLDNPKDKQALIYLSQDLTQEEVANKLKIHQSSISRLPQKIKKLLK